MSQVLPIDWSRMVATLPSAAQRVDKLVERSCRVLARTPPIHAIVRSASEHEAFGADVSRQLLKERLTIQTKRIHHFLRHDLRPGLSVAEAAQRYCALASRELYHLLTVELGWTAEHYQEWLSRLLHTELLGSHDAARPGPPRELSEPSSA